jgi:hypothetical protein
MMVQSFIFKHFATDSQQAFTEQIIFLSSRRKINLTTVIHAVFRGSNLFSNAEIGEISVLRVTFRL